MPYRPSPLPICAALWLAACGGRPVELTIDPSTDTAQPPAWWVIPTGMTLLSSFAWDPVTQQARTYQTEPLYGVPVRPVIAVRFDEIYEDGAAAPGCTQGLNVDGDRVGPAPWSDDPALPAGTRLAIEFTDPTVVSATCSGWDLDRFYDPELRATDFTWGVSFGDAPAELFDTGPGSLQQQVVDEQSQDEWDLHWEPYLLGASVYFTGLDGSPVHTRAYAMAIEVDDDWNLVPERDETTPGGTQRHGPVGFYQRYLRDDVLAGELPAAVYSIHLYEVLPMDPWIR